MNWVYGKCDVSILLIILYFKQDILILSVLSTRWDSVAFCLWVLLNSLITLPRWSLATPITVSKLGHYRFRFWTNDDLLSLGPQGTNLNEIWKNIKVLILKNAAFSKFLLQNATPFLVIISFYLLPINRSYLSSYPGYIREPHWKSMGLPDISRVIWQVRPTYPLTTSFPFQVSTSSRRMSRWCSAVDQISFSVLFGSQSIPFCCW